MKTMEWSILKLSPSVAQTQQVVASRDATPMEVNGGAKEVGPDS